MTSSRHPERALCVRVLNRVARKCGLQAIADNAARAKVESFAANVLACDLPPADVEAVNNSMQKYRASFDAAVPDPAVPSPAVSPTYKFQAVQLTYNSSTAPFLSQDLVELEALFGRFKIFLASLRASLSAVGVSATMERASPERVHLHAYLHLSKPFHRRGADALSIFKFEDSPPHVEPNRASGKAYIGAVKFGHFYVVCDKKGSLLLGSDLGEVPD